MAAPSRKPRDDAVRNRARIVTTAGAAYRQHGLDVSMREIARAAGLGVATVHRHFPTRALLVHEVLEAQVQRCSDQTAAALDDPDAWRGLQSVITTFAQWQIEQPTVIEALLGGRGSLDESFAEIRREHSASLAELVGRARRAGKLRAGLGVDDVRVAMMAMTAFGALPKDRMRRAVLAMRDLAVAGLAAAPA